MTSSLWLNCLLIAVSSLVGMSGGYLLGFLLDKMNKKFDKMNKKENNKQ